MDISVRTQCCLMGAGNILTQILIFLSTHSAYHTKIFFYVSVQIYKKAYYLLYLTEKIVFTVECYA